MERGKTAQAVAYAAAEWAKAPAHVKALAGAYVGPLLEAIAAMNQELQSIKEAKQ
jgi:hypothetical protein